MNRPRRARLLAAALAAGLIAMLVATVDLRSPSQRLEARFSFAPGTPTGAALIRSGEFLGNEVQLEIDGAGSASVPAGVDPLRRWGASWQELFGQELSSSVTLLGGGAMDHGAFSTQWCAARARRGESPDGFGYAFRPPSPVATPPLVGAIVVTVVDAQGRSLLVTSVRETNLGPRPWWQRWLRRPAHRVSVQLTVAPHGGDR